MKPDLSESYWRMCIREASLETVKGFVLMAFGLSVDKPHPSVTQLSYSARQKL